jgi:eukaryotic-like serine/threonine-protein kinase
LSTAEGLHALAANRGTEPAKLTKLVRGELDWIVMKALEKDRSRRYGTANGFASDIERYLHDEPVEASPLSAVYRFRKFARRYKGPVVAASLVLIALITGIVATTWQAIRATRAEALALANASKALAAAEQERKANDLAQRRLTHIEKANDILGSIFLDIDPRQESQEKPLAALLGERLEQAAAQLDVEAVGDPLTLARLQHTIASSQLALGHARSAIELLEKAHDTRITLLGPDHDDTLRSIQTLASAYWWVGRFDTALPMLEQVWAKSKEKLGPHHGRTLTASHHLARLYLQVGRRDEGLSLLEGALPDYQETFGPHHRFTLLATSNLGDLFANRGQFDKALPLFEQTLATQKETLGPDHVGTLATMNRLALAYRSAGLYDKALPLMEEALAKYKAKLGANFRTMHAARSLALTYKMTGQLDKASTLLEQELVNLKAHLDPDRSESVTGLDVLALAFRDCGDYAQAEKLFLQALSIKKQKFAADDPAITHTMASLGWNYMRQKRYAEAEPLFRECLLIRAQRESDKWQFFETHRGIGASLLGQQRYTEAEPHLVQAYEGLKQREATITASDSNCIPDCLEQIIQLYDDWGKPDEAAKWRKELDTRKAAKNEPP